MRAGISLRMTKPWKVGTVVFVVLAGITVVAVAAFAIVSALHANTIGR